MRIQALAVGVCAAALIPTFALAQQTCEQRQNNRVAGTVVGAGIGAIAGSAVAGRGDRDEGAVIGGIAGALIGNHLAKGQLDCARAYGFYDNNGAWHANAVARDNAAGYFDRGGNWIEGAPRGHYDRSGRWIAEPSTGRYNSDGVWMSGEASGRRNVDGVWVSDPQPGHYENGRWIRGEATGYYDGRGRWFSTDARQQGYDQATSQSSRNIDARQAWLDQRIRRGMENRRLSRSEGYGALRMLAAIEREERSLRTRGGNLDPRGQAIITARLDRLSETIREDVWDGGGERSERDGRR